MKIVTYQINSELDFQRITSSLDELNISYTCRKYSDAVFPVLEIEKPFAHISVSEEYEIKLQELIKELTNANPIKVKAEVKKSVNVWKIVWIVYSVITTVLLFKYWYINQRSSEDKNNTYEWDFDNTLLILKNKTTGKVYQRMIDNNYDFNFESILLFSKNGNLIIKSNDLNEDGYYEENRYYNLKGKNTWAQFDKNNDGVADELVIILQNNDTLRLVDTNNDGLLEVKPKN